MPNVFSILQMISNNIFFFPFNTLYILLGTIHILEKHLSVIAFIGKTSFNYLSAKVQ